MMSREELGTFISNKLDEIREAYEAYINDLDCETVKKRWENGDHHLSITVFNHCNDVMGMVGQYNIDDKTRNVHVVNYNSQYGHSASELCKYVEDLPDLDNMNPVVEEKSE